MVAVNRIGRWVCGTLLIAGMGCEQPTQPKPEPAAAGFEMPQTRTAAVAELGPRVKKFNDDIAGFPGATGSDHRKTLVMALDDLTVVLKLINGPEQSPMFTSSLAVIAQSRKTVENQTIPRERMAAAENDALAAIETALKEMCTRYLIDKDQLPALMDNLKTKVSGAAASQGPIHDLDATEAFQATGSVVQQMTSDLQAMVEPNAVPATETPAVPNTVTPASQPAPTPAPMPAP